VFDSSGFARRLQTSAGGKQEQADLLKEIVPHLAGV
jgi:hypothetical protein